MDEVQRSTHKTPFFRRIPHYKSSNRAGPYLITTNPLTLFLVTDFDHIYTTKMASFRVFLLSFFFIALSLLSISNVQASRKLLAPTMPNMGNYPPRVIYPPFPPVTDWPEYRLPAPLIRTLPPFSPPPNPTNP